MCSVGRVFDTYLGSAAVSCGLRGKRQAAIPPSPEAEFELEPAEALGDELPSLDLGEYSGLILKAIGDGNVRPSSNSSRYCLSAGLHHSCPPTLLPRIARTGVKRASRQTCLKSVKGLRSNWREESEH